MVLRRNRVLTRHCSYERNSFSSVMPGFESLLWKSFFAFFYYVLYLGISCPNFKVVGSNSLLRGIHVRYNYSFCLSFRPSVNDVLLPVDLPFLFLPRSYILFLGGHWYSTVQSFVFFAPQFFRAFKTSNI
jgi:hypothetical protein